MRGLASCLLNRRAKGTQLPNPSRIQRHAVAVTLMSVALGGCLDLRPSRGGGETAFDPPRRIRVEDVALPSGYTIELVARGLTFPTGIGFDDTGRPHVIEAGYAYGEIWRTPRLLRLVEGGRFEVVAEGSHNGPWTGVAFHDGMFFVA
jgi:hypothetical protein